MEGFHILFEERMEKLKLFYSRGVIVGQDTKAERHQQKSCQSLKTRDTQDLEKMCHSGDQLPTSIEQYTELYKEQSKSTDECWPILPDNRNSVSPKSLHDLEKIFLDQNEIGSESAVPAKEKENQPLSILDEKNYENLKDNKMPPSGKRKNPNYNQEGRCIKTGFTATPLDQPNGPECKTNQKIISKPDLQHQSLHEKHNLSQVSNADNQYPNDSFEKQSISNVITNDENSKSRSKSKSEKIVKLRECKELYRLFNQKKY